MNNSFVTKIIKYILSIFLTIIIVYFLFKHQDPVALVDELKKVDLNWIILSMIFGALAYVSRGLRWKIMLEAIEPLMKTPPVGEQIDQPVRVVILKINQTINYHN